MESRNKPATNANNTCPPKHLSQRPPSAPILDVFDSKCANNNENNQWNKCTVPVNQLSNPVRQSQLRTLSMPQLSPDTNNKEEAKETNFQNNRTNGLLLGPPKPPRTNVIAGFFNQRPPENTKTDKTEIRVALQNWRLGLMSEDKQVAAYRAMSNVRSVGDGKGTKMYSS